MVVEGETTAVTDETETAEEVIAEHPFASVTITKYDVVDVTDETIEEVVAPVLHE